MLRQTYVPHLFECHSSQFASVRVDQISTRRKLDICIGRCAVKIKHNVPVIDFVNTV